MQVGLKLFNLLIIILTRELWESYLTRINKTGETITRLLAWSGSQYVWNVRVQMQYYYHSSSSSSTPVSITKV